ncbi:endonuclease/exonuclease/phosphatase family protein [bacterium]|nr:endonuclease/exonuclease/phosphatase family protein [bacterium]
MKKTLKPLKKGRTGKRLLIGIVLVIGCVIGWYGVVRLISPWTVVKFIPLQHDNPKSSIKSINTLRVGCYNIAHGRGGRFEATNWEGGNRTEKIERMKQIGQMLKSAQLDIVVLNEVDFSSVWSGHIDQARMIAQEAGYPYLVEQRNIDLAIPFVSIRFGNAILSKYPVSDVTFLDYPNTSELTELFIGGFKEGVAATIHLSDTDRVQVVAVHLSVNSESVRLASARMLLELLQQSSLPLIAMGDFNTAPTGYPQHHADESGQNTIEVLLASQQLTTLPQGLPINPKDYTFPSEQPARIIDWIFVSSSWQIQEKTVISSNLSDHLPVIALLTHKGNS